MQQIDGAGVEVIGPRNSEDTRRILTFVRQARIAFTWRDPSHGDDEPRHSCPGCARRDPAHPLSGGRELRQPTNGELSRALGIGLELRPHEEVDLLIIGAGPAGLGAAVYGASEGLDRHVVHLEDDRTVAARAVLIATGADYRRLPVADLERYSEPRPGAASSAAVAGAEVLARRIRQIAEAGRLRVGEERAAHLVAAAGRGTTLTLIAMPADARDPALSTLASEAIIAAITTGAPGRPTPEPVTAAITLRAVLPQTSALSKRERGLLQEWLDRIADVGH